MKPTAASVISPAPARSPWSERATAGVVVAMVDAPLLPFGCCSRWQYPPGACARAGEYPSPAAGNPPPPCGVCGQGPRTSDAGRTVAGTEDFDRFYAAAFARLVGQLALVTGDRHEAEDVVQEAMARAAPRWARLRAYDAPEAWVRRVAFNLAVSGRRRARRRLNAL